MNRVELDPAIKDKVKDLGDFLTVSFFITDEIYQSIKYLVKRSEPTPYFSDSEVICLSCYFTPRCQYCS